MHRPTVTYVLEPSLCARVEAKITSNRIEGDISLRLNSIFSNRVARSPLKLRRGPSYRWSPQGCRDVSAHGRAFKKDVRIWLIAVSPPNGRYLAVCVKGSCIRSQRQNELMSSAGGGGDDRAVPRRGVRRHRCDKPPKPRSHLSYLGRGYSTSAVRRVVREALSWMHIFPTPPLAIVESRARASINHDRPGSESRGEPPTCSTYSRRAVSPNCRVLAAAVNLARSRSPS